ncbi:MULTISPECIES: DinB family protein [Alicyclobacillus]|uniref:Damage-inducible protein DinB n=2 Tax=Alicyclobacillus tolerans TaxID=90970 RepID=A0ABT9LWF6_9BACL|nr:MULTISPECIES: DinB family protein [Alicyclobacillus]MDP9728590.1 putative damage-inducible protein DinB [Alicyclobacillus tengchongensis]SHJ76210.1 Uncharacterized damage-inducible protein DinB (forms a four-helix bundle) [Alicyclobacillus montanus]
MNREQVTQHWFMHRNVTLDILQKLPESALHFKPWDGALSLADLIVHMHGSSLMFSGAVKAGRFERPSGQQAAKPTTLDELRQLAAHMTEETKNTLLAIPQEHLEKPVEGTEMFGGGQPLQGKTVLSIMIDHEIHHKGQLFVYARMVGVQEMPMFMKRA